LRFFYILNNMTTNLSNNYSLISEYMYELRDKTVQQDKQKFRLNIERIGELIAYEISKEIKSKEHEVETVLGSKNINIIANQPVIASIMRAGIPLHNGILRMFDKADNAFISAYRKHNELDENDFRILVEYLSCPPLDDRILIVADPMLATGASLVACIKELLKYGKPSKIHVVSVLATYEGIENVKKNFDNVSIWCGDIDDELTAKSYIVPGLGDAGDLCYGEKIQS
jgi:uracil phosphoribosyltransferase